MELNNHGGDIYSFIEKNRAAPLDFSASLNPLGMPKGVAKILRGSVRKFEAYPDPNARAVTRAVADFEGLPPSQILCGNGCADIIYRIAYALKPKRALLPAPTFSEYQSALENSGCRISYFDLKAKSGFELDESILSRIKNKDVLFICNPNNPTGSLAEKDLLIRLAKKCSETGCALVIDESFNLFLDEGAGHAMKSELSRFSNLIILKAFTKIYAMAGLRFGYCLCSDPAVLSSIEEAGQPWSVSAPAQLAALRP